MAGPLLPRPSVPADPMAPIAPKVPSSPTTGDPMAPVGEPTAGAPIPLAPTPASQSDQRDDQSGARISDQLASARITARKLAKRRQQAARFLIASMLLLAIVVAGLGIGYATGVIRFGMRTVVKSDGSTSNGDPAVGDEPARRAGTRSSSAGESGVSPANSQQGKDTPVRSLPAKDKTAKPREQPLDAAQVAQFQAELRGARQALGERQYQQAKDRIDSAKRLAVSEEQNRLVKSFQALTMYVEGFWQAVREGLQGLETAGELKFGGTVVSVVEVGPSHLLIREAGENRRYSADQLPARVAMAIARHWFDGRPDNKLYLGAFHFVGPPIDVAEAKRLWEEAAAAGVDVEALLALLEM